MAFNFSDDIKNKINSQILGTNGNKLFIVINNLSHDTLNRYKLHFKIYPCEYNKII